MDRRPLVIAVLGAMATLAVVALLLVIPAADRCTPTGRDLWTCLRDDFSHRYMQRGTPGSSAALAAEQPAPAAPIDLLAGQPAGEPTAITVAGLAPSAPVEAYDLAAPAAATTPPPAAPAPAPPAASPELPLPPTIDIIAFDGSGHVEGEGPEGARILLFLDDTLAGSTRVAQGRWAVDGVDLGASLSQELRVEAHDWDTGALLGSSTFSISIELPAPPHAALPPPTVAPASAPATGAAAALDMPISAPDSAPPPAAAPAVAVNSNPEPLPVTTEPAPASQQDSDPVESPTAIAPPPPSPPDAAPSTSPRRLPGLRPVTPHSTSPSVTLLKGGSSGSITTLGAD